MFGPANDNGVSGFQRSLDLLREFLSAGYVPVPPDLMAFPFHRNSERSNAGHVLA
jgi:hypothetical protein